MNIKTCEKCGARFLDSQLYWSTGKPGSLEDLAGLVCNTLLSESDINLCINPRRGDTTGTTWEYRRGYVDGLMAELSRNNGEDLL